MGIRINSILSGKINLWDLCQLACLGVKFIAIAVTFGALIGGFFWRIVPVIKYVFIYQGIRYMAIGIVF